MTWVFKGDPKGHRLVPQIVLNPRKAAHHVDVLKKSLKVVDFSLHRVEYIDIMEKSGV